MDKKRLKKIIIYILLTFTVLIFAALIVLLPVTRIYDAIEIKIDDPSYTVPCRVEIRCFYHWNVLTDDMFEGRITVTGYDMTYRKMSNVFLNKDGYPLEYHISAHDAEGRAVSESSFFGRIYAKPLFRQMMITVFGESKGIKEGQKGWSTVDGYCVVPGAENREEALKVVNTWFDI